MMRPETFRKVLLLLAMGFSSFTESYIMAHTACLVAALFQEKDDLQITDEQISWIITLMFSSIVFGTFLATVITETIGRRLTVVVFMIPIVIYWIMLYYARSFYVFLVARLLAGIGFGGSLPIIYMNTAECSSAKMRGFNLAIVTTVMPSIGGTAGKSLGIGLDWRTASLIGVAPALLATILPIFCVESPPWLASKGRFDECEATFTSLHGLELPAQKELQLILQVEKAKLKNSANTTNTIKIILTRLKFASTKWYFWKIMLLTNIINIYKLITGRLLYSSYGIVIIQKLSGQSDILPHILVISAIEIVGGIFTIIMMKKVNVRSLLLPSGILNCLFLLGLAISLYIVPDYHDSSVLLWTNVSLYILHLSVITLVLYPISEALSAELFPLEIRSAGNSIVGLIGTVFVTVVGQVIPATFVLVDMYKIFFITVGVMLAMLLYLWMQLPETKGRTLHEIELSLKNEEFVMKDELVSREQKKELI